MSETISACDARVLHTGFYSAWLSKVKGEGAKARWMSSSGKRYFTLDYEAQLFYYSHSQDRKKISNPVKFKEILNAEQLPRPAQTGKSTDYSFGFVVQTPGRAYELYTISYLDAKLWVDALIAARDIASGTTSLGVKPSAATSREASMSSQSTTADGGSDRGNSSERDVARYGNYTMGVAGSAPFRAPQAWNSSVNQNGGYGAAQAGVAQGGGYGNMPFNGPPISQHGNMPFNGPPISQPRGNSLPEYTPALLPELQHVSLPASATRAGGVTPATAPIEVAGCPQTPATAPIEVAGCPQDVDPFAALDALEELAGPPPEPASAWMGAASAWMGGAVPQQNVNNALFREARAIVTNKGQKPSAEATVALQQLKTNSVTNHNQAGMHLASTGFAPAAETQPLTTHDFVAPVSAPKPMQAFVAPATEHAGRHQQNQAVASVHATTYQQPLRNNDFSGPVSAPKPMQAFVAPAADHGVVQQQNQTAASLHATTYHNPSAESWDSDEDELPNKSLIEAPAPAPIAAHVPTVPTPLSIAPQASRPQVAGAWAGHVASPPVTATKERDDSGWDSDDDGVVQQTVCPPLHHQHATAAQVEGLQDSGWDSDDDKQAHANSRGMQMPAHLKLRGDACGAPAQPVEAFVAAKPSIAAPKKKKNVSDDDDLDDLVGEVLAANTSFPSRHGGISHCMVPGLHCTGCDFQVLRVDNHIWGNGVEYMFFRNNYPNTQKMRSKLVARKDCCAYCCQCSWKSAESAAPLADVAAGLRWRSIGF